MPTQLQLRRGNTAQTASFTGAVAEVTVDTDKNTIIVHDGSTAGGHEISGSDSYARPHSNAAFEHANAAFTTANTGGGGGESGFNPFLLSGM